MIIQTSGPALAPRTPSSATSVRTFNDWLRDNPPFKDRLIHLIHHADSVRPFPAKRPTANGIAKCFLNEIHASMSERPPQVLALRNVERYIRQYAAANLWLGKDLIADGRQGRAMRAAETIERSLTALKKDGFELEVAGVIVVDSPHGVVRVPIERMKIVPKVSKITNCILAYEIHVPAQPRPTLEEKARWIRGRQRQFELGSKRAVDPTCRANLRQTGG